MQTLFKKNHKKIGILGGNFAPAHIGHIKISRASKKKFKLDYIIWAITKKNPFKKQSNLKLKSRINISKTITRKEKFIKIKFYEKKIKSNKTIDLINYFKKKKQKTRYLFYYGSR